MLPWPIWVLVGVALAATQLVALLAAWALGRRVPRLAMVLGLLGPVALTLPWLDGTPLILPTGALAHAGQLPLDRPAPPGEDPWAVQSDVVLTFVPWEIEVRRALQAGGLAFWSDRLDGGSSPWANPQAEVLSPTAWIGRLGPLEHHHLLALLAKLLLAIEGAYLLATRLGARAGGASIAGLSYGLGGAMIAWALFPLTSAAAWIPWHTLAVVGLWRAPGSLRPHIVRAALATAVIAVAGHPETALGGGLLAVVVALSARRRDRLRARLVGAAVAALLGATLAAPLLLPVGHAVRHSQRFLDKSTATAATDLFVSGGHQLFGMLTNPHAAGRPYQEAFRGRYNWCEGLVPYAGVVAFAGLVAALLCGPRPARTCAWFALATLILASGWRPLAQVVQATPGINLVTWERVLMAGGLATALAAGLVLPGGWRRQPRRAVAVATLAAAGFSLWLRPDPWVIGLWLAVGVAITLLPRFAATRRMAPVALAVVVLVDLLAWARPQLPEGRPEWFFPPSALLDTLAATVTARTPSRVVGEGHALYPNHLAMHGFEDLRGHDPLARADRLQVLAAVFGFAPNASSYFSPFRGVDHPLLDRLNVTAVVSPFGWGRREGLALRGRFGPHSVWFNRGVLPRWFFPERVDVVADADRSEWLRALNNPRRVGVAVVDADVLANLDLVPTAVVAVARRPGREVLALAPSSQPRLLATSIPWPEAWRASVDDTPGRMVPLDGAFVGVLIPAGATRVVLGFTPPGLRVGLMLAVFAVVGLALVVRRWP